MALTTVLIVVLVMLLLQVGSAWAQTPSEVCAADSLYLISPEAIDLRLETTGRRGLTISWPDMELEQATCFSLKDTDDLGFEVTAVGGFGDRVDRVFNFSSPDSGTIGSDQPENIVVTWQNVGPATYGNMGGKINLTNNGGILRYTPGVGWSQTNVGLPMSWLQTNTVGVDQGSGGFMVAGFTSGVTSESDPVGLYSFNGTTWTQLAAEIFTDENMITGIAISPQDNNSFAVGTARNGLYITTDGGQNFTQWTMEFDPANPELPPNFIVEVVEWQGDRVFAFLNNFGLFVSQNNGVSFEKSNFTVPENLDVDLADFVYILPVINSLSFHPTDPDRLAASLNFHGAYESRDGGVTWQNLYGDLNVPDLPDRGAWVHTGLDLVYDEASPETMVMGVFQEGLYRTTNGGTNWVLVGVPVQPDNPATILRLALSSLTGSPGTLLALEDGHSLLQSTDSGATWAHLDPQPQINKGYFLLVDADGGGGLTIGSWGGGIYVSDTLISLSDTYSTITTAGLRSLDLGLDISFSEGIYNRLDNFQLICQTFQGWAVWRGPSHAREEMTLIGLFDRVNPEDCFEGYCGDLNIEIVPNCYAAKRAACFQCLYPPFDGDPAVELPCVQQYATTPDTIRFFDEEIYNGFIYNYAVTSFDYGNTARVTPENNSNSMLFSPRFEGDFIENGGVSPFPGSGNITSIQINEPLGIGEDGYEEIYVFPNPLRQESGFPRDEGGAVTFKNIPDGSKVLIFTTAGDRVIDIGPETILGGNIHWDAHNSSGEAITSGVYLYKVEMKQRDDFWGRLVVIR